MIKNIYVLVFILELILSQRYDFWLLEVIVNGDAHTHIRTELLLTPGSPELDLPQSHAEICYNKRPEIRQ